MKKIITLILFVSAFAKAQNTPNVLTVSSTEIVAEQSIVSSDETAGIITLDARQSTSNNVVTGDVSGQHEWLFRGMKNVPKIDGSTTPLSLVANANVTLSGGTLTKSIAGNSWNASGYSVLSFDPMVENFAISWLVESVDGTIREMAGLDDNPTQNNSYTSIEFAPYQVNNYVYSRVYESGTPVIVPDYTTFYLQVNDRIGIKVINQEVTYFVLRGTTITDVYTSAKKATVPLYFKAAFNRGNTSSGASVLGGVVVHDDTEIDNFTVSIKGFASDVVSDEDKELLSTSAGLDCLSSATYSFLQFTKDTSGKFESDKEYTHEYRSLANQSINTF